MRTPHTGDLIEAWADRYCTEHTDLDHDNGCPAEKVAQEWLTEHTRQAKEQAWDEGYETGIERGMGLAETGYLTTRRHELGPIPTNPYAKETP